MKNLKLNSLDAHYMLESLNQFSEFTCYANYNLFEEIFGERLGEHFWYKLVHGYRGDFTKLYLELDNENKIKLANYLTKFKNRKEEKDDFLL